MQVTTPKTMTVSKYNLQGTVISSFYEIETSYSLGSVRFLMAVFVVVVRVTIF